MMTGSCRLSQTSAKNCKSGSEELSLAASSKPMWPKVVGKASCPVLPIWEAPP